MARAKLSHFKHAYIYLIFACLLWASVGLFTNWIPLDGPNLAFYRVLFAGFVLLPFGKWQQFRVNLSLLTMVMCFALMNVCFVTAMTVTSAANAIFLQYTAPIWMTLGAVVLFREKIDLRSLRSIGVAFFGILVIVLGSWQSASLGIVLALLAGVFFAGVGLSLRHLRGLDSVVLTVVNLLGSALILYVLSFFMESITIVWPSQQWLFPLVLFGTIQLGLPYILYARGLRSLSPQEVGVICLLEPVFNPLLVGCVFGKWPNLWTVVGGAAILLSVLVRIIEPRKLKKALV